MTALVAVRYHKEIKLIYAHLITAGKSTKLALIAIMRKIIICLNTMIKNNMKFVLNF